MLIYAPKCCHLWLLSPWYLVFKFSGAGLDAQCTSRVKWDIYGAGPLRTSQARCSNSLCVVTEQASFQLLQCSSMLVPPPSIPRWVQHPTHKLLPNKFPPLDSSITGNVLSIVQPACSLWKVRSPPPRQWAPIVHRYNACFRRAISVPCRDFLVVIHHLQKCSIPENVSSHICEIANTQKWMQVMDMALIFTPGVTAV